MAAALGHPHHVRTAHILKTGADKALEAFGLPPGIHAALRKKGLEKGVIPVDGASVERVETTLVDRVNHVGRIGAHLLKTLEDLRLVFGGAGQAAVDAPSTRVHDFVEECAGGRHLCLLHSLEGVDWRRVAAVVDHPELILWGAVFACGDALARAAAGGKRGVGR